MSKGELIKLINLGIIDKNNKKEIKFILSLNQGEIDLLFKNKEISKRLLNVFIIYKDSKNYKSFIEKILKVDDYELVDLYINIMIGWNLFDSKYYEFIIDKLLSVKDIKLLGEYTYLITDLKFLDSSNYEFILNNLFSITSVSKLEEFSNLIQNEKFLDFKYYKYVLTKIIEISGREVLEKIRVLASNPTFMKSSNYINIFDVMCKVKDARVLTLYNYCLTDFNMDDKTKLDLIVALSNIDSEIIYVEIYRIIEVLRNNKEYLGNNLSSIIDLLISVLLSNYSDELVFIFDDIFKTISKQVALEKEKRSEKGINIVDFISSNCDINNIPDDIDITYNIYIKKINKN